MEQDQTGRSARLLRRADHRMVQAVNFDDRTRTWQLVMTGHNLQHVTLGTQADMARLLDLNPSISHLTLEIGDDRVHIARDWPSDQYEEADRLIDRIAASGVSAIVRSEEHTSELQSLMRISYAVFCLKKKTRQTT